MHFGDKSYVSKTTPVRREGESLSMDGPSHKKDGFDAVTRPS